MSARRTAGSPGRVLVVDDDEGVRTFVRVALEEQGYEVLDAADGEAAVRAARRHRPDLVLLDVRMPGVDGWDVLGRLRDAAGPQAPVVVMTGGFDAQDQALASGSQGYLGKPFGLDDLLNAVEAHVGLSMAGAAELPRVCGTP